MNVNPGSDRALTQESRRILLLLLLLAWSFLPVAVNAEGIRNPPPGAFNLGRAGGRIAHVDDSSAVHQNPANLVDLRNTEFQFSPSIVYMGVEYESPAGDDAQTENPWKLLPNLFGAVPLNDGKYAIGFGLTVPYGLSVEWERDGAFENPLSLRYAAPHFAELKTINANPAFAIKLNDRLSIGVGINVMWSEVTFKQLYPWFIFPGSIGSELDGNIKAQGDGFGYGGNAGITWQITKRQRAALTYRSAMDVNYNGDFRISNITPTAAFLGATEESDFDTKIRFPNIVALGYGIELTDRLRVEANVEWVNFSRFQSLDLGVENNAFLFPSTKINQNWHDTFTIGIGGDYRIDDHWIVRAGYQFYESPVPDDTLSTTIPDANQNVFTVGLAYRRGRHALEAAYGLDFYDHRDIDNNQNPAFNGEYDFNVHLFSFAYRFQY